LVGASTYIGSPADQYRFIPPLYVGSRVGYLQSPLRSEEKSLWEGIGRDAVPLQEKIEAIYEST
jgi:hypothetical protein